MLGPEEIAALGVQVALAARSTEGACVSELCKAAVKALEDGPDLGSAVTASASVPGVIVGTIARHPYMSAPSVSKQVADALSRSAGRDASALGVSPDELADALAPGHDPVTAADAVAANLKALAARDNLAMGEDARRTLVSAVSRWVPAASRGEMAYEECVRRIVEECAKRGVKVVDYASGRRTSIDVAARRHVVTQVQQAAASRSLAASASMGEGLVFVTSHVGARPSHREWQGRPFAAHGPLTVDGVTYQDLAEATGYGTPGGLCGAQCRHSFGPWLHWQEPPYSHTPDEDAGLDPDEAYVATQAQRANERAIRQAKLEADALREAGQDDAAARLKLGRAQASQRKLLSDHRWLKRRPELEKAYGKGGKAVSVRPLRKAKSGATPIERSHAVAATSAHRDEIRISSDLKGYVAASQRLGITDHGGSDINNLLGDMTAHAKARAAERGITDAEIIDALTNPVSIGELEYDDNGRPSRKYRSKSGTIVAFDPATGKICSVFRSKKRMKGRGGSKKG